MFFPGEDPQRFSGPIAGPGNRGLNDFAKLKTGGTGRVAPGIVMPWKMIMGYKHIQTINIHQQYGDMGMDQYLLIPFLGE